MSIGASRKRTSATANDKTIAQPKTRIIKYSVVPTEGTVTPRTSQTKLIIFFLRRRELSKLTTYQTSFDMNVSKTDKRYNGKKKKRYKDENKEIR